MVPFTALAAGVQSGEGSGANLVALATLTLLEIVLGIDNVIFIAILAGKLPPGQQAKARQYGIAAAVITRILLLLGITWVMGLTAPLFSIWTKAISGRDVILLGGGLFLIGKSTFEIHEKLETAEGRKVVHALARRADLVMMSYRAGVAEKHGVQIGDIVEIILPEERQEAGAD